MNELQKKLARRRALNGEGENGSKSSAETHDDASHQHTSDNISETCQKPIIERKIERSHTERDTSPFKPKESSGGNSELLAKLNRRRNLNGETQSIADPNDHSLPKQDDNSYEQKRSISKDQDTARLSIDSFDSTINSRINQNLEHDHQIHQSSNNNSLDHLSENHIPEKHIDSSHEITTSSMNATENRVINEATSEEIIIKSHESIPLERWETEENPKSVFSSSVFDEDTSIPVFAHDQPMLESNDISETEKELLMKIVLKHDISPNKQVSINNNDHHHVNDSESYSSKSNSRTTSKDAVTSFNIPLIIETSQEQTVPLEPIKSTEPTEPEKSIKPIEPIAPLEKSKIESIIIDPAVDPVVSNEPIAQTKPVKPIKPAHDQIVHNQRVVENIPITNESKPILATQPTPKVTSLSASSQPPISPRPVSTSSTSSSNNDNNSVDRESLTFSDARDSLLELNSPSASVTSSSKGQTPKSRWGSRWYPGKYLIERRSKSKLSMDQQQAEALFNEFVTDATKSTPSKQKKEDLLYENLSKEELIQENKKLLEEIEKLKLELAIKQAKIDAYELTVNIESAIPSNLSLPSIDSPKPESFDPTSNASATKQEVGEGIDQEETILSSSTSSQIPVDMKAKKRLFGLGYYSTDPYDNEQLFDEEEQGETANNNSHKINSYLEELEGVTSSTIDLDNNINEPDRSKDLGLDALLEGSKSNLSKDIRYQSLKVSEKDLVRSYVAGDSVKITNESEAETHLERYGLFTKSDNNQSQTVVTSPSTSSNPSNETSENNNNNNTNNKLFKDESEQNSSESNKEPDDIHDMSYNEFLAKFSKTPKLTQITKLFILSVTGPEGDGNPPPKGKKVDYVFYGTHRIDERCKIFFEEMHHSFSKYDAFKHEHEERLIAARDGLEQYVMNRIAEFAFPIVEVKEEDEQLMKRMNLLSFLTPEHLDIKTEFFNETLLLLAGEELRKINTYRSPHDKITCIVKCVTIIFRSLSLARTKQETEKQELTGEREQMSLAGADDFLPLFIWVVLHSRVPKLFSNCEYIQTYLNPARLMSKSGYCLINLRSAIEFVNYIEASSLNIDSQYFEEQLHQAEIDWENKHPIL